MCRFNAGNTNYFLRKGCKRLYINCSIPPSVPVRRSLSAHKGAYCKILRYLLLFLTDISLQPARRSPSTMPVTSTGCFIARLFIAKKFFKGLYIKGYPPSFVVNVYASHTPLHQLYKRRYPFGGSRFILLLPASGYLYTRFNLLFSSIILFYIGVCAGRLLRVCNVNEGQISLTLLHAIGKIKAPYTTAIRPLRGNILLFALPSCYGENNTLFFPVFMRC